jgi:putative ABC transport system permease protein
MSYILSLAFRNVWRNKRRSLLAFLSIAIALLLTVFLQGWRDGLLDSLVKNYTKNETGHIRIAAKKFEDKYRFAPVTEVLADPGQIIRTVMADPEIAKNVAIITQRITFGVMLANNGNTKTTVALAGDPETEKQLLMLNKSVKSGRYLSGPRECLMGSRIAESLNYRVGDTVRVMTQGSDYALHLKKFVMAGIFETGMNVLDDAVFQIPLDDAKNLLAMGAGTQQIVVLLKDYRKAASVAAMIRRKIPDPTISVAPWTTVGDMYHLVRLSQRIYGWIYVIVILLGAFIISNIMMMVVIERRKEIGILKSMGVPRVHILGLFLAEGTILGLFGSIIGGAAGYVINIVLHFRGVDFTAMTRNMNYPMDNMIYFSANPLDLAYALALGTALAAAVSLLPSRQAARINVVDAIKSV